MSLHQFYFDAQARARKTGERYGQAMFNHLYEVRPDLSEQVRGQDTDPFYVERLSQPRWDRFVTFLEANWNNCAFCLAVTIALKESDVRKSELQDQEGPQEGGS
jgi:hypothetical protein